MMHYPRELIVLFPRSMQLNPAYRRKALKTVPREWIAKLYEAMNTQAFASS